MRSITMRSPSGQTLTMVLRCDTGQLVSNDAPSDPSDAFVLSGRTLAADMVRGYGVRDA
eukprot:IDg18433t1